MNFYSFSNRTRNYYCFPSIQKLAQPFMAKYLDVSGMNTLEILDFTIYYNNKLHIITAAPYLFPAINGIPLCFETTINGKNTGDISCVNDIWENNNIQDKALLNQIGSIILSKYRVDQKIIRATRYIK